MKLDIQNKQFHYEYQAMNSFKVLGLSSKERIEGDGPKRREGV